MWLKQPLWAVPLKYGLLAAAFGFLFLWILYAIGRHPFLVPVFFDFRIVLLAFAIFFALRELREQHFSGLLFFWQGMMGSAWLTLVFAAITSALIWGYAAWQPQFVDDYIRLFREQAATFPAEVIEKIGKENMERNLAAISATKPSDLAILYAWQTALISLFVSIVLAVILRRQPKTQ
jgi:hypothetical protein